MSHRVFNNAAWIRATGELERIGKDEFVAILTYFASLEGLRKATKYLPG
jgi:hypothetical protein